MRRDIIHTRTVQINLAPVAQAVAILLPGSNHVCVSGNVLDWPAEIQLCNS